MSGLTIVANIKAAPDQIALVKAELEKLVPLTRAEAGCIKYDLHQDNMDPARFVFVEIWETRELWRIHMNAPHLTDYMQATDGAVTEFILNEMTQIA